MIVKSEHLRTIPYFGARRGYCVAGARAWFAEHCLDFREFMRNGLPEETLLSTGDGMALALVKWAHESVTARG
jgi:hypothetical protein